jgi:hypothetical protein
VALKSFFAFMQSAHAIVCPWAAEVVDSVEAFVRRSCAYPLELADEGGAEYLGSEYEMWHPLLGRWSADLRYDLNRRVLLHDSGEYGSRIWAAALSPSQMVLHVTLQRSWLLWRDHVVAEGEREPERVRRRVLGWQRGWEQEREREAGVVRGEEGGS